MFIKQIYFVLFILQNSWVKIIRQWYKTHTVKGRFPNDTCT